MKSTDRKKEEKSTREQGNTWILVAVDNSDYAKLVVEEAAKVAQERKANVVFVSVVHIPSFVATEGEVGAEYLNEQEKEYQDLHNRLIDHYFKGNKAMLVESKILHGDPASKIVSYANEIDADLIVMGSKGQGKLASVFLGSVSKHVVNNSKRSVLLVKQKNKG
jgi:nucleotide-binding universal stress UspA family protein